MTASTRWAPEILGNYHWSAVDHDYRHPSTLEIPEPDKCRGCAELKRRREAWHAKQATQT